MGISAWRSSCKLPAPNFVTMKTLLLLLPTLLLAAASGHGVNPFFGKLAKHVQYFKSKLAHPEEVSHTYKSHLGHKITQKPRPSPLKKPYSPPFIDSYSPPLTDSYSAPSATFVLSYTKTLYRHHMPKPAAKTIETNEGKKLEPNGFEDVMELEVLMEPFVIHHIPEPNNHINAAELSVIDDLIATEVFDTSNTAAQVVDLRTDDGNIN